MLTPDHIRVAILDFLSEEFESEALIRLQGKRIIVVPEGETIGETTAQGPAIVVLVSGRKE